MNRRGKRGQFTSNWMNRPPPRAIWLRQPVLDRQVANELKVTVGSKENEIMQTSNSSDLSIKGWNGAALR